MSSPRNVDLAQAKRLMDVLYEHGDTFYAFAYHDRPNVNLPVQSSLTFDAAFSARMFMEGANSFRMAVAASVGVFSPSYSQWGDEMT